MHLHLLIKDNNQLKVKRMNHTMIHRAAVTIDPQRKKEIMTNKAEIGVSKIAHLKSKNGKNIMVPK